VGFIIHEAAVGSGSSFGASESAGKRHLLEDGAFAALSRIHCPAGTILAGSAIERDDHRIELSAAHQEFDPRISAVVRVDATRLRAKLREYYASEGVADELIIQLPRGSYVPVFSSREASQTSSPSAAAETAVAVLPFSNLSPQPEEYFSDGLTEAIIHALSAAEELRVVARTSAFAFKHKNSDVREIGRTLNVGLVL
jgi:TolB-like protein